MEELAHQLKPSAKAGSQCLVNNSQESCNDIRPTPKELDFDLPMDILETNRSVTSEKSECQLSHLVQTTIHSSGAEANSVEEQTKLDLCNVCGDVAGKHTYFGGKSCPSCRQFFRRSVILFRRQVHNCIFKNMRVFLNLQLYITRKPFA